MKNFKLGLIGIVLLGTSLASLSPESVSAVESRSNVSTDKFVQVSDSVEVAPQEIVAEDEIELDAGGSVTLQASVLPANTTNKQLLWSTTDEEIATVDANGQITGVNPGSTVIDVTTADGKITKYIDVTVNEVAPKEISVDKENVELHLGNSSTLKASVLPANATDKELFWISEDESIATVDDNGKITGKKVGTTTISVLSVTNFGEIEKRVSVTVKEKLQSVDVTFPARNGLYFSKQDLNETVELKSPSNEKVYILLHLNKLNKMYNLKIGELDTINGTGLYNVQPLTLGTPLLPSLYYVSADRKLDNSKMVIMYVDKKNPKIIKDYFIVREI